MQGTSELAVVEDADDIPEHMKTLTELQRRFVTKYVTNGAKQTKAARQAGYDESSAHVAASRLIRNPKVIAAIRAECEGHMMRHVPAALVSMLRLSTAAKSEHVRYEASRDILDRSGMTVAQTAGPAMLVQVNIDMSP